MSKSFDLSTITPPEFGFLAKHIRTYNHVLIDINQIKQRVFLSEATRSPIAPRKQSRTDRLNRLPCEIILNILAYVDIETIFHLRASCWWLKYLVETWEPYQTMMTDAQGALQAMIATKASRLWTVHDLTSRVYTTTCELCHQHGEVLHLLKMRRVCFNCVTTDRRLLAVFPEYALHVMGLTQDEVRSLPHISTIRQPKFWGGPVDSAFAVDYGAAVDLAMTKYHAGALRSVPPFFNSSGDNVSFLTPQYQPTGILVDSKMQTQVAPLPQMPICRRRRAPAKVTGGLPNFLLRPPEACYRQHASCVYFPTLRRTPAGAVRQKALACAGCAHYWNYHSSLPTECHQLFPHDKYDDLQTCDSRTPFEDHLSTCLYARAYWDKLYPPGLNHRNESHPDLIANGGSFSVHDIIQLQQAHVLGLTTSASCRFRHAVRHSTTETRLNADNNRYFELIPSRLMHHAMHSTEIVQRTGLDIELELKRCAGDPTICSMLSDPDVDCPSDGAQRTQQLQRVRKIEEDLKTSDGYMVQDSYWDLMLGSTMTVSQAGWATSRPGGSNGLFRGWLFVLDSRRRSEAEIAAKNNKIPIEKALAKMSPWGFDRFGNVSDLA